MLTLTDFRIPAGENDIFAAVPLRERLAAYLRLPPRAIGEVAILRHALDARRRGGAPICHVLQVSFSLVEPGGEKNLPARLRRDRRLSRAAAPMPTVWERIEELAPPDIPAAPPIVVGFGPAGMFCALALARAGLKPLVLERGAAVEERTAAVDDFWQGGALNPAANVQFGEGGAGTFSDGKLTTRADSPLINDVLQTFVDCGAPPDIAYEHKAHIGTDELVAVVRNLRRKIVAAGGEVRFNAQATDFTIHNGKISGVTVAGEDIPAAAVFLAIGHSARDTYARLYERGINMAAKPFAVGVRIEHPQELIDRAQYGMTAREAGLPPADYALTFRDETTGRGVYSFCMCPGGQVVAAASERNRLVTNGMSRRARASGVANSALLVSVTPADFGGAGVLAGVEFQRRYEELAFSLGGGDYRAPVQAVGDFLRGADGKSLCRDFLVLPSYRPGYTVAPLDRCLPPAVAASLRHALPHFDNKINGFAAPDAPLTGVEMRSSAPCRIERDKATLQSVNCAGLYPVGEGAGYAGGIMSAACDGLKAALAFLAENRHN